MSLITKTQVVSLAFSRKISETKITDSIIKSAEWKYIKPILGKDLYNAISAAPTDSKYSVILPIIQEALAWWVKYIALPEILVEISDTGAHLINASNAQVASDQRFIELKEATADTANRLTHLITDWLNDDTTLTDYYPGENPQNQVEIAGGILFDTNLETDIEEDNSAVWRQGRGTKGQTY